MALTLWHHTDVLAAARAQREGELTVLASSDSRGLILTDQRDSANLLGQAAVEVEVSGRGVGRGRPFPDGEVVYRLDRLEDARLLAVTQPWHKGDNGERFRGYSDPETGVLHNFVGATDPLTLRQREDELVETRGMLWRDQPQSRSFDLRHLKALHADLFQDVYPWAGEARTVDMARHEFGQRVGPYFEAPENFERVWRGIAGRIAGAERWQGASRQEFVRDLPEVFNGMNSAHVFREGNGRTQREFLQQLASEAGFRLDWRRVTRRENDRASQAGREGDLSPLRAVFDAVVEVDPRSTRRGRDEQVVSRVLGALPGRLKIRPGHETERTAGRGSGPTLTQSRGADYDR